MLKKWDTYYLEEVESWLEKRTKEEIIRLSKEIKLLEYCGNELRLPHSRSLGKNLFELRERFFGYRIY